MKKQTFLSRRTTTTRLHNKVFDESPQRKLLQNDAIIQGKTFLIKDPTDGEAAAADTEQPISQPARTTPLLARLNGQNQQQQKASSLDSSMALTILVLLTALFFMGFFSLFLRRFSTDDHTSRRRRLTYLPSAVVFSVSSNPNQKGKGLDVSTVRSLPLVSYGEDAKHVMMFSDCPICLTEFEKSEIVKIIPHCRHVFHPKCIDTWLASHVSCPFCRSTIFFKDEDVDGSSAVKPVHDDNGVVESNDSRSVEVEESYTSTRLEDRVVLQRSFSF